MFAADLDCHQIITQCDEFYQNNIDCVLCVCEVGTEILYAIAMTVSPHRVKNFL